MRAERKVRAVCIFALALGLAASSARLARADVITVPEMVRGINKSAEQCAATPQAVWISALGHSYCMRYYLAPNSSNRRPIVFLQGDRLGVLNLRTGAFAVPDGEHDIDTNDLMRFAVMLARDNKATAIYLGRVGVEGSSGDHRIRHSVLELEATNAALEAIKQQYHFEGFNLIGQSGGAHLVAGLLGMRQDIGCAVIGSGPLAPVKRQRAPNDIGAETYNPLNNLEQIAQNRSARIMVVTDPADRKVNADKQTEFVKRLQQAGRQVEHYLVQATDENRHGVVIYSRVALAGCLRNDSVDAVAQQIQKMVERRVAATSRTPERRNDASRDTPTASGDVHNRLSSESAPPAEQPPKRDATPAAPETTHR